MTSGSHTTGAALWQPLAQMSTAPANRVTIVGGEGSWIETDQGVRLLDATAGLWHANIGHGREALAVAAANQMRKLETYHTFGTFVNDQAVALADRVAAISPIEDAKVFFVSGGSDAIEAAAKRERRL